MRCSCVKSVLIVFIVIMSFGLSSCEESNPGVSQTSGGSNKVAVTKKRPKSVETKVAEVEKVPEYRYSRVDKRNPFVPLVALKKKASKKQVRNVSAEPAEEMTPLQKIETNGLRLLGIIIGKGASRAMVDAPDGKSYILKNGTKVGKNNGVVVDISSTTVFVKEKYQDFSGEINENIIEIGLPDRGGDR